MPNQNDVREAINMFIIVNEALYKSFEKKAINNAIAFNEKCLKYQEITKDYIFKSPQRMQEIKNKGLTLHPENKDDAHNDSVDALKHSFIFAKLASTCAYKKGYSYGYDLSSMAGYFHEAIGYNEKESRMDMYNNEVGRRIGLLCLEKILSNPKNKNKSESEIEKLTEQLILKILYSQLINGNLITDPFKDPNPSDSMNNHLFETLFPSGSSYTIRGSNGRILVNCKIIYDITYPNRYDFNNVSYSDNILWNLQLIIKNELFKDSISTVGGFSVGGGGGGGGDISDYTTAPTSGGGITADDGSGVEEVNNNTDDAKKTISPIILDLNCDGVKTISITNGVKFDHDNNGFAEQTGWVDSNDGLLVLDKNSNGKIDNGTELFGENTILSNGKKATGGFEALAA